jgi:Ribosomal protein S10p/S20e
MYSLIQWALTPQKNHKKINRVKFYSFRKYSFNRYILLLIRTYKLFSNQLFLSMNSVKYNTLLHIIYIKQFIYTNINFITSISCLRLLLDLSYFNNNTNLLNIDINYSNTFFLPYSVSIYYELINMIYNLFFIFIITTNFTFSLSSLPNTRKLFTLLRSPHTDKKSREQFTITTHSKSISMSIDMYSIIYTLIKTFNFTTLLVKFYKNLSY